LPASTAPCFGHVHRGFVLEPATGLTEGEFLDRRLAEFEQGHRALTG